CVDDRLAPPESDRDRIGEFGYSLGGYLLARAAAFEHRLAALILDDGVHDLASGFADNLPPFVVKWVDEGHDEFAGHILSVLPAVSSQLRWALGNGLWVFGVQSYADVLRTVKQYTLDGVADQIV